ncbi:hypothetical protein [Thalassobacillus sp. C254]|uniref:hypothetical protein n=1 Tax=Thalassobacillus sp. C254 TaxID=1225341 RepID=UPI0006D01222|nr:hypothetical protein [Thalassobacillus sp. C254]
MEYYPEEKVTCSLTNKDGIVKSNVQGIYLVRFSKNDWRVCRKENLVSKHKINDEELIDSILIDIHLKYRQENVLRGFIKEGA